ncbi:unnamed protein product [Acanthoscelides obtectus]|uniref:Uncharacterized protein n=1 Tax=Acanthoscelides obtectus TaxID=200917 RepID=A0A9P0P7R4_ACAOB|nr:unnamed protein product [Acanthoscelides obtectus]CAK1626356.1 hypothetical protein AOBTE_LOCUS3800 [Acanthoscelides obtectus]
MSSVKLSRPLPKRLILLGSRSKSTLWCLSRK